MLSALTNLVLLSSHNGGGAAVFGFFFIIMIVIALVFMLIWLGLAYWTYKDASKRGMDSPIIWAIVVFMFGLIGIIIYLVVRD